MALSYLHGARSRLESAMNAFNGKDFPYVVRQSQECVELCLKSVLRFVGIEPPKWHDVGEELSIAPEEIYHEYDAKVSSEDASFVYEKCEKLISEK